MPYTGTTFLQLRNQLAERLNDTGKVWTTDAELGLHILDAIRFWNVLTGDNKVNYSLAVSSNPVWYDLFQIGFIGTRIQTTGGSTTLKYLFAGGVSVNGLSYTLGVSVYNAGVAAIQVGFQFGLSFTVLPGQLRVISVQQNGDGATQLQIRFQSNAIGDSLNIIAFNPLIIPFGSNNAIPTANLTFAGGGWSGSGGSIPVLTQGIATPANSPRLCTLTDQDVYLRLTYGLLESPSTVAAVATAQFTTDDLVQAVQRKRDEFLFKTGCTSAIETLAINANQSNIGLPQTVIEARRAYWLPNALPGALAAPLFRNDEFGTTAYGASDPTTPGQPLAFSAGTIPSLTAEIMPPPNIPGSVEFLTIESQGVLNPAQATTLLIPQDFMPALLWGAMADLMSLNMDAQDTARAALAQQRFDEYVALTATYPGVMSARVNNVPIFADAVESLDIYAPTWRTVTTNPAIVGLSGQNLVAYPTNQSINIVLFMVGNAVLPVLDTDFVQLGSEVLDAVLDEAQSTASFKMGGQEATQAAALHVNIVKLAMKKNNKIRALSVFRDILYGRVDRDMQVATLEADNAEG